jgi:hypothetical protein
MFGIYTLMNKDSTHWILVQSVRGSEQVATETAHDLKDSSGDFCTRAYKGHSEILISREIVRKLDHES